MQAKCNPRGAPKAKITIIINKINNYCYFQHYPPVSQTHVYFADTFVSHWNETPCSPLARAWCHETFPKISAQLMLFSLYETCVAIHHYIISSYLQNHSCCDMILTRVKYFCGGIFLLFHTGFIITIIDQKVLLDWVWKLMNTLFFV